MLMHFKNDAVAFADLKKRFDAPTLKDEFYALLRRHGFSMPMPESQSAELSEDPKVLAENIALEEIRVKELCRLYKEDQLGELHDLAETLIDIDELIALWRTHHVTVVERIIGFKRGTGGSEGVAYLRSTLVKRCFQDLWSVRTALT